MRTWVVISTAASEKEGWRIAQKLVEGKLAACVNVIPKVTSFFYWKGKLCREREVIILIKTIQSQLNKLINEIKKIHSYEVPEVISLHVDRGEERYLQWVNKTLAGKKIKKY